MIYLKLVSHVTKVVKARTCDPENYQKSLIVE